MADQNEQQTGQPVFRMQKMYIKDLSFESPHAPQVFQASQKHEPTIELDLKLKHEVVAEDNYEVSMTVTAKMVDSRAIMTTSSRGAPRSFTRADLDLQLTFIPASSNSWDLSRYSKNYN